MLTHLRFKNWRSLKDVEINDLTPITVFIGANSSGKTNILDGLHFLRYAATHSMVEAIFRWGGREKLQTIGSLGIDSVELEFSMLPDAENESLKSTTRLFNFDGPFHMQMLAVGDQERVITNYEPIDPSRDPEKKPALKMTYSWENSQADKNLNYHKYIDTFISKRWQMLGENYLPKLVLSAADEPGDLYLIESNARNVPYIVEFLRQNHPDLYANLQGDLKWLLDYVDTVETIRDDRETRVAVHEKAHSGKESPTISSGTARIFAVLTAFYALDMRTAEQPGLVVIEEPDSALNPLLLKRFMELIRSYVDGEHPRQVIMTTHNPHFLDLFQPEEVRIVERDDQGYTTVKRVPEDIKDIWLDEYGLGEVWTTRSLGGVPE